MRDNFPAALAAVLEHEGGFVNNPRDPGGATNRGVTQEVYDDWRVSQALAKRGVRAINDYETAAIYKRQYWNACRCDDLPSGVDYCVFDFAVNSGVNRASRYLQKAVSVADDGHIGPQTLAAVATLSPTELIEAICAARLDFLKHLSTFDTFGRGWERRVVEVEGKAEAMAA